MIALLDAALVVSEMDPETAKATKKAWQNSHDPKLPTPIGVANKQKQLFSVDSLINFINLVMPECSPEEVRPLLIARQELGSPIAAADGPKKTSAPSVKAND